MVILVNDELTTVTANWILLHNSLDSINSQFKWIKSSEWVSRSRKTVAMNIDLGCGCEKWHGNILLSLLSDKQGGYEDWIKAIVHWWSKGLYVELWKGRGKYTILPIKKSGRTWKKSEKNVKKIQTNEEKIEQNRLILTNLQKVWKIRKIFQEIWKESWKRRKTWKLQTMVWVCAQYVSLSIKNRGEMVLVKFNSIWKYLFFRKESKSPEKWETWKNLTKNVINWIKLVK